MRGCYEACEKYTLPVQRKNLSNMVKEREQLAEAILNHALEIICLLTVEDYIIVKRPDGTRCAFSIRAAEVKSNTCDSTSGCPELSFTLLGMEDKTQRMIAQLANKIIQLWTRKVTCEAVAVHFAKDECEYLQGHGAQSKNSQDTFTIEQPTAPVQRSTEQSYPIRCYIKEEPEEEQPHSSTGRYDAFEKYTLPVQRENLLSLSNMVKEREQLAEAILNHALEIICLLAVEDFIVVKRPDGTRCTFNIRATEVKSSACDSTSGYPELSFTLLGMEDKTQKMITELASKIVQLLTRKGTCEGVAVYFSKDECEYLGKQSKDSQDTCTIEQPTAPVQRSTEQSYPIRCCIKEEPQDGPHYSTEQPTSPVQQSTEQIHHIKCCKVEPDEEPLYPADGTSALPPEFVPGSPERKPLSIVNVHLPFMEAQSTSEFKFISAYNIKLEPGGDSSGDTEDSADEDGTSARPSSAFIPGRPERKPLSTVNVHLPFMEAQTTSGFNFPSSCDNEPGGESSDDTEDSADEESPKVSRSGRKKIHGIVHLIEEEPKESQDSDMSVSEDPFGPTDCTDKDYSMPKTKNKRAWTHKSRSGKTSPPCDVCGKVLSDRRTLKKHLQIHTGQRTYQCSECDKSFSYKSHFNSHIRMHIGERPFPCNQCGRRFIKHQHLVLHQVVHTGEKPYSCPVCGKGFTRQSSVVKHSGIHAEKKPFVCNECGKSYCQYASLVVHQRQHSGEKPFVCKYCEKAFPCKDTMLRHQRAHKGEKPFACPQCNEFFIDKSSLSKHKRKVHAKEPKPALQVKDGI
ncbi:uncharacterized protein [Aquarana catesbeiana]|uniref:uncharacterized protein isoform X3 n=1 Tax=Aquarana catesbeiana TaxID=8400 RepID=UPI003CC96545